MIDLLERAPDSWQMVEAVGDAPAIRFYYGVRAGEMHLLPLGAHYGVVSSPNPHVNPQSYLRPWAYVVFEVCLYQFRRGRPLERSYKQVQGTRHTLSLYERQHFEALWLDILMMGRKAG